MWQWQLSDSHFHIKAHLRTYEKSSWADMNKYFSNWLITKNRDFQFIIIISLLKILKVKPKWQVYWSFYLILVEFEDWPTSVYWITTFESRPNFCGTNICFENLSPKSKKLWKLEYIFVILASLHILEPFQYVFGVTVWVYTLLGELKQKMPLRLDWQNKSELG